MELALGLSLGVSAALALVFIAVRVKWGGKRGLIAKAVASFAFVLTGAILFTLNAGVDPAVGALFLTGLLLGFAGDVFLDYRQIETVRGVDFYLNSGMFAFGLGHAAYLAAILLYASRFVDAAVPALAALAAVPFSAVGVFVMVKILKMDVGRFVAQSFGYLMILLYVALLTFGIALTGGVPKIAAYTVGAILFLASDVILSFQYFGGQEKNRPLTVLNHLFYYAAQLTYAGLIAFLVS